MASAIKCKECKEYYPKVNIITSNFGKFCSNDCMVEWKTQKALKNLAKIKQSKEKKERKEFAAKKRAFYANDIKTRKAAAKKACHDYIRERDKGKPCICCGQPMDVAVNAGHFYESGNHPFIRYHEDNIHAQRVDCNMYKGGDSGSYKDNLIDKIGIDKVKWLESNKNKPIKRKADDYKEIEDYYKAKLKVLKSKGD